MREYFEKIIAQKRSEMETLFKRNEVSENLDEVRAIGESLSKLRDEINDAEAQLKKLEGGDRWDKGKVDTASRFSPIASFEMHENGASTVAQTDNTCLQRGQTLSEFYKTPARGLNVASVFREMSGINTSEKRTLLTSGAGYAIPDEVANEVLTLALRKSFFANAGCKVFPMSHGGKLKIGKIKAINGAQWLGEGVAQNDGSVEIGGAEAKPHTLRIKFKVSNEALTQSVGLESAIINSLSGKIAEQLDYAFLNGSADAETGTAPQGILNGADVQRITATNLRWNDFIDAIGKVRMANYAPSVIGYNSHTESFLAKISDDNNHYIEPPKIVANMNHIVSNNFKATDAGDTVLVLDPASCAIVLQNNMHVKVVTDSDECLKENVTVFFASVYADCVLIDESGVCVIDGFASPTAVVAQENRARLMAKKAS